MKSKKAKARSIRIGVQGYNGRMGVAVQRVAKGLSWIGEIGPLGDDRSWDVVLDFSSPKGFREAVRRCCETQTPLVSGTTGLNQAEFEILKGASKKIPILWAPNMSEGVAVVRRLLASLRPMEGWDVQIVESHRRDKKDAPSGTALMLQDELKKRGIRLRQPPLSMRGGDVPGEHEILFLGPQETVRIGHTAFSREVFARGGLLACRWLLGQQTGLYQFEQAMADEPS